VVPPRLRLALNKIPCVMQQGEKASVTLFRYVTLFMWLYPCPITGAPELGYLHGCVRPFNSEVHSASALLPRLHHVPLGSLEIALKRTRPRQRICILLGGIL
jgi:hypothetical protein